MSPTRLDMSLSMELTHLVASTPGVTRIYPPVRAVPVLGTAQRILSDLGADLPEVSVQVDVASSTVTASIGVDASATAAEIGAAVCTRIRTHLAASANDLAVKITIASVAS